MRIKHVFTVLLLGSACTVYAQPTVNGTTISWPDNGWYQVQDQSTFRNVCEGGTSCAVPPGTYLIINHSTGERFRDVAVGGSPSENNNNDSGDGFVFSRTDTDEFRYVMDNGNIWIDAACASQLGGASQSGAWSDLNAVAPNFDSIPNPCIDGSGDNNPSENNNNDPGDGFVFSRTDTDEFRYVMGNGNIWIGAACASQLGGASQSGTWSDLNAVAPNFDSIPNPCIDGSGDNNPSENNNNDPGDGFVFSRTDTDEFRYVMGNGNIWIDAACASQLGGASQSGTWSDLNAIAPDFDSITNPCAGTGNSEGSALQDQTSTRKYIVVLKGMATIASSEVEPAIEATAERLLNLANQIQIRTRASADGQEGSSNTIDTVYGSALNGFSANLTSDGATVIGNQPEVDYVELDREVSSFLIQDSPGSWGLDRIDQRDNQRDNLYEYQTDGTGVHAYIVDTGIFTEHAEFAGRIGNGRDLISNDNTPDDCAGHGTHVAAIAGGSLHGVAKNITLHGVRALDCDGTGSTTTIIAGIKWIISNLQKPAVVNMSLGGEYSQAMADAVNRLISAGAVVVAAAGNSSSDACRVTPAAVPDVITVGSSDRSDQMSFFSNFGTCVDIFAPGSDILSASIIGRESTQRKSGTSMAAPHVAGAVALLLQNNEAATPAQVATALTNESTKNVLSNIGAGSPNRLLYSQLVSFFGGGQIVDLRDYGSRTANFGESGGWSNQLHVRTVGDVNGDGRDDLIGFTDGVFVELSNGNGFDNYRNWSGNFGDSGGWSNQLHVRTVGDVNGDGRDDLVGFTDGVFVELSNGSGFDNYRNWSGNFGDSGGWNNQLHVRTVGDVNGDGRDDLVGFTDGVFVELSNGNGFDNYRNWSGNFGDSGGWSNQLHVRTVGDVNGDGRDDLVGFADHGVWIELSNGSSFEGYRQWTSDFGNASGQWSIGLHPRLITDVNGDGMDDIVGFGDSGVFVALSNGSSFGAAVRISESFGRISGRWGTLTRTSGDLDGDGNSDILGFTDGGVFDARVRVR